MNTEERLVKIQARLDYILYKENGITPNLEDYDLFSKKAPSGMKELEESDNQAWLAIESIMRFFTISECDFQTQILDFIDGQLEMYSRLFYYEGFAKNHWSTDEEWKDIQIIIAKRNSGKPDGIVETNLVDVTTFKEVLELLASSANPGVANDAKKRLEKDFSDAK